MSNWTFPFCPRPPDWALDWPAMESAFPWLALLRHTPQDPTWHGEGDVLTHTRMVLEALVADADWRTLSEHDRDVLFVASLLHDIGKSPTTRQQDGRIVSPHHTSTGQRMARRLLWSGEAGPVPDFTSREAIAALVRHHGLPVMFLEKTSPERAVITASLSLRCDRLALLAKADVLGRICPDTRDFLDRINLFREFCAEQECLSGPRHFESDVHRFSYCTEGRNYHYVPYDDSRFEVTLMSGLPAAGKSHWIQQNGGEHPVIRLDDVREDLDIDAGERQGAVAHAAKELARGYMRKHQSFIWDATNITRMMRGQLVSLFTSYTGRVRIVYVECPHAQLRRRNQSRPSPVPADVIDRLVEKLEVPTPEESHGLVAIA